MDLVAGSAVGTDHTEVFEAVDVGKYLVACLAAAVIIVWRIRKARLTLLEGVFFGKFNQGVVDWGCGDLRKEEGKYHEKDNHG